MAIITRLVYPYRTIQISGHNLPSSMYLQARTKMEMFQDTTETRAQYLHVELHYNTDE